MKKQKRNMFGHTFLMTATLICALVLSGCGGGDTRSAEKEAFYAEEPMMDNYAGQSAVMMKGAGYAEEAVIAEGSSSAEQVTEASTGSRKLIRDMSLDVETRDFDGFLVKLEEQVKDFGGYVENSSIYNGSTYGSKKPLKNANYTVRIPWEKLESFVEMIQGEGNVTNKSLSVKDVTLTYVDLESHRNALREEEKQLLALMEQANTIEELISIRNSLTDVRYQLESMESQLRTYDNLVTYSTVTISVSEVEVLTPVEPKQPIERITEGFMENLDETIYDVSEFLIEFVIHLPEILWFLVRFAICVAILVAVIRLIFGNKEKREERRAKKEAKKAEKLAEQQRKLEEKRLKKAGGMPQSAPNMAAPGGMPQSMPNMGTPNGMPQSAPNMGTVNGMPALGASAENGRSIESTPQSAPQSGPQSAPQVPPVPETPENTTQEDKHG